MRVEFLLQVPYPQKLLERRPNLIKGRFFLGNHDRQLMQIYVKRHISLPSFGVGQG